MSATKWLPLESNPSVMNKLLQKFGVSSKWQVMDIISLDEEYLNSISNPIIAIILLFPYTKNYKTYWDKQEQHLKETEAETDPKIFFMRQTIRNSCGTVAMIHAIANNMDCLDFEHGSIIKKFIEKTALLDPNEKAAELENNDDIRNAHESCVLLSYNETSNLESTSSQEETSKSSENDEGADHHYISFIEKNSKLYELDGYKDIPIYHGATKKDSFLVDAARICLDYMKREQTNLNFTALAFGGC